MLAISAAMPVPSLNRMVKSGVAFFPSGPARFGNRSKWATVGGRVALLGSLNSHW